MKISRKSLLYRFLAFPYSRSPEHIDGYDLFLGFLLMVPSILILGTAAHVASAIAAYMIFFDYGSKPLDLEVLPYQALLIISVVMLWKFMMRARIIIETSMRKIKITE